jgi:hypothetical protein
MNEEINQDLLEGFQSQETPALLALLKSRAKGGKDDAEMSALSQVLEARQSRFPSLSETSTSPGRPIEMRSLSADSNGSVGAVKPDKIELHFPKDGFIRCERSTFKNHADLSAYIAEVLGLKNGRKATQLSVKRRGKYQRLDHAGSPVYTFGDPILDLITDEHGWVTVGKATYHLTPKDLKSPANRKGGIISIDLGVNNGEIRRQQLAEALADKGGRTLVEHTTDRLVIAKTDLSQMDFWHGNAHLRFHSWKKNYGFYRSIGTEIETWGADFIRAEIQSLYADPVVGSQNPFVCGIVKRDSDSDSNDDYVDEYEYSYGAPPRIPSSVRSNCLANWKGQRWGGVVSKGDCQSFL